MDPNELSAVLGEMERVRASSGSAGIAATALALVYLAVRLTKLPLVDRLLGYRKWLRPVIALALGAAAGALRAMAEHQPWSAVGWGAVMGAFGGMTAVGLDQLVTWARPSERARADIALGVEHVVQAGDADVVAKVSVLKAELDAASTMQDPGERRRALADWGRRHVGLKRGGGSR